MVMVQQHFARRRQPGHTAVAQPGNADLAPRFGDFQGMDPRPWNLALPTRPLAPFLLELDPPGRIPEPELQAWERTPATPLPRPIALQSRGHEPGVPPEPLRPQQPPAVRSQ